MLWLRCAQGATEVMRKGASAQKQMVRNASEGAEPQGKGLQLRASPSREHRCAAWQERTFQRGAIGEVARGQIVQGWHLEGNGSIECARATGRQW